VEILTQQRDHVQARFTMLTQKVKEILALHHGDLSVVQQFGRDFVDAP
jgi:hypothetical protein